MLAEITRDGSIDEVALRYCRRRIDRTLKKIDLKNTKTVEDLTDAYAKITAALDVTAVAKEARDRIDLALEKSDLPILLANFDNKALLVLAARFLKNTSKENFESWLTRALRDPKTERLQAALIKVLPKLTPN